MMMGYDIQSVFLSVSCESILASYIQKIRFGSCPDETTDSGEVINGNIITYVEHVIFSFL